MILLISIRFAFQVIYVTFGCLIVSQLTSAEFADSDTLQDHHHFIERRNAKAAALAAPKAQPHGVYAYTTKNVANTYDDDDYGYTKHTYSYDIPRYAASYPTYGTSSIIYPLTGLSGLSHNGLGLHGLGGLKNLVGLHGLNGISGLGGIGGIYGNGLGNLRLAKLALYNPLIARLLALNLLAY